MKKLFIGVILTFVALFATSQCDFNYDNNIIINEVGSFPNGHEYIELLVVGNPENPFAPVSVKGMIIDDNNAGAVGVGNEPGHIRLANSFPDVEPGTLILIYNPESSVIDAANDGYSATEMVYQLPIDSDLLNLRESNPFNKEGFDHYTWGQDPWRGETWKEFVPLRNLGDCAQVRTSGGELIHSIAWYSGTAIPYPSNSVVFSNTTLSHHSIEFTGENPGDNSSFSLLGFGSPGTANNGKNEELIENLKSGIIFNVLQLDLSVVQNATNGLENGIIQVELVGSQGVSDIWLDCSVNDAPFNTSGPLTSPFLIENLSAGTYDITVSEAYDQCFVLEGQIELISEKAKEEELCEGECITLNSDNVDPNLIANSPCIKWIDEDDNVISSGTEVEVCPEGTEYITQYIENEEGLIQEIIHHVVTTTDMSFTVDEKIPDECPPSEIEIAIEGENIDQILWSDGTTENILIVTSAGEYSVTLTSPEGCVSETSVTVNEDIFLDTDGDGICDQKDCDPYEAFSGGEGTPCDDYNESTINDTYNAECECIGEVDPDDPCMGNDIDGDGICDEDEENNGTSPFDPCDPNGIDTDLDGICDNIDCDPNDYDVSYSVGDPCDDYNSSTIGDKINQNCECEGFPDPNSTCPGNDIDGDGICDDQDSFPEDECNGLSVEIKGITALCYGVFTTDLSARIEGGIEPFTYLWSNDKTTETINADINESVEYSVTITDAMSCTSSANVQLGQYEDENGDGNCEEEGCQSNHDPGDVTILSGTIQARDENGLKSSLSGTRDNCEIDCDPAFGTNICVKDYVDLKYTAESECIASYDAVDEIITNLQYVAQQTYDNSSIPISLYVTRQNIICSCPELETLYEGLCNDIPQGEIIYWINFVDETDPQNSKYEVRSCGYDENTYSHDAIISITDISAPFANEGKVHSSQLEGFLPDPTQSYDDSNELLSDYAGLSDEARQNILYNINLAGSDPAEGRWGYDLHIVTSSECKNIDQGDISIPSYEVAESAFGNSPNDVVIWIHYAADNSASLKLRFGINTFSNSGWSNTEIEAAKEITIENVLFVAGRRMEIMIEGSDYDPTSEEVEVYGEKQNDEYYFGLRKGEEYDKEKNFFGISKEVLGLGISMVETGTIDNRIWKKDGESVFDFTGIVVGPVQGLVENNPVVSILGLLSLGKSIALDKEVRDAMTKAFLNFGQTATKLLKYLWSTATNEDPEIRYHFYGYSSTTVVLMAVTGSGLSEFLKKLGKNPEEIAKKCKGSVDDISGASDEFFETANQVLPDQATAQNFTKFLGEVGPELRKIFIDNPEWVKVYKKYVDDFPSDLDNFKKVITDSKIPVGNKKFFTEFKAAFVSADGVIDGKVIDFFNDLHTVKDVNFVQLIKNKPEVVKAWEKLSKSPAVRIKTNWLKGLNKWIDEGYEFIETSSGVIVKSGDDVVVEIVDDIPKLTKHKVTPKPNSEVIKHADEVIATFPADWDPPYNVNYPAIEFRTIVHEKYVRVYNDPNRMKGAWIVKKSEIEGKTPQQIKDYLALDEVPTKIVDANVPPDFHIRTGKVAARPNIGNGGAIQFQLLETLDDQYWVNPRNL
ncbi:MAG: hypothetical protein AAGA77_24180 [Bacteroidota bacterium]